MGDDFSCKSPSAARPDKGLKETAPNDAARLASFALRLYHLSYILPLEMRRARFSRLLLIFDSPLLTVPALCRAQTCGASYFSTPWRLSYKRRWWRGHTGKVLRSLRPQAHYISSPIFFRARTRDFTIILYTAIIHFWFSYTINIL